MKAPTFYATCPHPKTWMYCSFNAERRALLIAVDGREEFVFHTQLRAQEAAALTDKAARQYFEQAVGQHLPIEILSRDLWMAGRALVADHFQRGRVLLGGDAVHLFTPTGGMGYNTAIEDAVNIGWKLAAVLKKQAPQALLESYEAERRPVALRNTAFARQFADSIGLYRPSPAIEADRRAGESARRRAGEYLAGHAQSEFNIPGFTFGARYYRQNGKGPRRWCARGAAECVRCCRSVSGSVLAGVKRAANGRRISNGLDHYAICRFRSALTD